MTPTQWLEVLLSYSLQVVAIVLTASLLERAITKPAERSSLWNALFVSILFLGCAGLLLPRLHLVRPWSLVSPHTLMSAAATERSLGKALFGIWMLGAISSLVVWIVRGIVLRRSLSRCQPVPGKLAARLLPKEFLAADKKNQPRLLISDDEIGPFCWQFHRATIVLPRVLFDGAQEDLRHVLAHELAHLKNNHPLQLFLEHMAQVVLWFHPAVWRASSRSSLMREYTCDDVVVSQGVETSAYLRTLLHVAERFERKCQSTAIGFSRTPTELVLRAKRLVEAAKRKQFAMRASLIGRRSALLILAVTTCLVTQLNVPSDPLCSSRTVWSTWPTWTAETLRCFGVPARDYEFFDPRVRRYEQVYDHGGNDMIQLEPTAQSAAAN